MRIVESLYDATVHQRFFLSLMAAQDISDNLTLDAKITAIAESLGVKFKNKR